MKALFSPDLDAIADEEDVAEFRRGLEAVGDGHRRVLEVLIPRLVALQERGDSVAALTLIAAIKTIVTKEDAASH